MKSRVYRRGFTIIEVILFLGISGLLLVGLLVGTSSSVARQRYNDSVNSFKDLMQDQYMYVSNVDNDRNDNLNISGGTQCKGQDNVNDSPHGRTKCMVYGKLIEFATHDSEDFDIRVTTVIGNDVMDLLNDDRLGTSSTTVNWGNDISVLQYVNLVRTNIVREYQLEWGAKLRQPHPKSESLPTGAILIVRAPVSNSVKTFVVPDSFNSSSKPSDLISAENQKNGMDFCIASDDLAMINVNNLLNRNRRMVRVEPNGSNASSVEIIPLDLDYYNGREVPKCNV